MVAIVQDIALFIVILGFIGGSAEQIVETCTTRYKACYTKWCQRQQQLVLGSICWRNNGVVADGRPLLVAIVAI